jgi:hypothetical protein
MATPNQRDYIADLAVMKTKEFKEVKELLIASNIVADGAKTVGQADTLAEITNALSNHQASKFIDALIAAKEPARSRVYAQKRVEQTAALLDTIKTKVSGWNF